MLRAWLLGLATWWRRRRSASLRQLHFLLYSRQGCHLCEVARRQVQAAQRRYRFTLQVVDVDAEPELAVRYGSLVPVVMLNGKMRFRGAINPILLNRLLQAEKERAARALEKRVVRP